MAPRYKGLVVILDGLGDRPTTLFRGATPLEAAYTPQLNRLATAGICGMIDPLAPGIPVATHTGTGILLGLSPGDAAQFPRGPVEAAGIGLDIKPGDIAIRCNFATLQAKEGKLSVISRRAGRISEGTNELAAELQNISVGDGISATLQPATQHRAVLRLSGKDLSANISDTDPDNEANLGQALHCHPLDSGDHAAIRTADAVNHFVHEAHKRLATHPVNQKRKQQGLLPANGIITRGAGKLHRINNIINHLEIQTALIAGESSVCGLGKLFGFTVINEPSFTALPDTDLAAKVAAARLALNHHDLVFLHIKAPDICAHDLMPDKKRDFLEQVDAALLPLLTDNLVIGISGDHSTDSTTGNHCADPVPSLIYYPETRKDCCQDFSEASCMNGGLGRISATGFLLTILDAMGSVHCYRPRDRAFYLPSTPSI